MKYTLYTGILASLVFSFASCSEAPEVEPATPESTPAETPAEEPDAPAESPADNPSATEDVAMSEVAKQVAGKLVIFDEASGEFKETEVDGSIDYYLVSLSASW